ncbi:MAG: PqqD family protein [Planctomycetes bacterium]|nr:PqqD family protein [Planctomycetota bacterium]
MKYYSFISEKWLSSSSLDGGVLIVSADKHYNFIHILNGESAAAVWKLLANPITIDTMLETLMQEFNGDQNLIKLNINTLLDSLTKTGIIKEDEQAHNEPVIFSQEPNSKKREYKNIVFETHSLRDLLPEQITVFTGTATGNTQQAEADACNACPDMC